MDVPWTAWWQDDLPCQFSRARARENCEYLCDVLDRAWIQKLMAHPGTSNHPLMECWVNRGGDAYLRLNGLAEDLQLIDNVAGFDTVTRDLKNTQKCLSAWHVVRSAALFARGRKVSVKEFLAQTSETVPDFLIDVHGSEVAIEAKFLGVSSVQEDFEKWSKLVIRQTFEHAVSSDEIHPRIFVVAKDPHDLPMATEIQNFICHWRQQYRGEQIWLRTEKFNLLIVPPPPLPVQLKLYRSCMVLCPRSLNEDFRVVTRTKNAEKQLRPRTRSDLPGVFCLELGQHQDPHFVSELLMKRFRRKQYRGISGVLLSRSGTHLEPPMRCTAQFLGLVRNNAAFLPYPSDLTIMPLGITGHLLKVFPKSNEIPSYRAGACEARVPEALDDMLELTLPDVRSLTPEMLA